MYERYTIPTAASSPLTPVPNKFRVRVKRTGLAKMLLREAFHYRFKKATLLSRPCIYGVFSGPIGGFAPRTQKCTGCLRCVQEYPDICEVSIDERYLRLGDSYFDPDAVSTLNYEASTGKIPVRGVGYKGAFAGEGFDGMWTDMSEIVRPTRDGIYGREHISTHVDLGCKRLKVPWDNREAMNSEPIVELPLPIIFDTFLGTRPPAGLLDTVQRAAKQLRTFFVVPLGYLLTDPPFNRRPSSGERAALQGAIPLLHPAEISENLAYLKEQRFPLVEIYGGELAALQELRSNCPESVLAVRLALGRQTVETILQLAEAGLGTFHLTANYHGRSVENRFVGEALQSVHEELIRAGCREELTLIVSGGIVRAEHVPKSIICGADLVALDTAVWLALGARLHGEYPSSEQGTLRFPRINPSKGAQRVVNFCAAWRDQMLEILSAMGLREVRRLRGELGRAMFVDQLEQEAFGDIEAEMP